MTGLYYLCLKWIYIYSYVLQILIYRKNGGREYRSLPYLRNLPIKTFKPIIMIDKDFCILGTK